MKMWIMMGIITALLVAGIFAVNALQTNGKAIASIGCGKCGGSCSAETGSCGLAGCGAANGGECTCNKSSCGGSCSDETGSCGSAGCGVEKTGSCGCGK